MKRREVRKYAYIRVSTREQNVARQIKAMRKLGIRESRMYIDRQSGRDFNRPQYQALRKELRENDILYIKSIDRLGRNYEEIIEEWKYLTQEKKVHIVVLDFPLLDTRQHIQGLTGRFIADMVLQVLSYVAQIERENTKQRQMEGIQIAKENGVKFGRPKSDIPDGFEEIYERWKMNEISKREASRMLKTSHTMFTKWVDIYEKKEGKS